MTRFAGWRHDCLSAFQPGATNSCCLEAGAQHARSSSCAFPSGHGWDGRWTARAGSLGCPPSAAPWWRPGAPACHQRVPGLISAAAPSRNLAHHVTIVRYSGTRSAATLTSDRSTTLSATQSSPPWAATAQRSRRTPHGVLPASRTATR
jgi:hypothetical protein